MKNLTKIFMAVVAGMFAFACVTDTTMDPAAQVGNEANGVVKTVLSVEIANSEELRTQLGEFGSQGYPMYWSNGDKISVNGKESIALTLGEEQTNVVNFTFDSNLSTPYCVTYPAAAEGQVKFEANQSHASNTTFGNDVATMYAYSEDGEDIQLQHLTGVLKIGVVGSANLVLAQISTVDRAPIAGAFAFDFVKGEATPTTTSKNVISYSFGEGAALSTTEPTYLHIAVPAGVYDELYVTLYDNEGGVMYATVKAGDNKPLAAGKVREFKKNNEEQFITYAPNAEVYAVKSAEDLVKFAADVNAAGGTLEKNLLFVNDIDMEGVAWTPLTWSSNATILGNGYAIKNLKAPLFEVLTPNVKGLHLKDVNITANGAVKALAALTNDFKGTTISNCSVSGSITATGVNRSTHIGAFVGILRVATEISNCTNNASISVTMNAGAATNEPYVDVAGLVGHVKKVSGLNLKLSNNTNNGSVSIYGATNEAVSLGGIVGKFDGEIVVNAKNCTNSGALRVEMSQCLENRVGGIWGKYYHAVENNGYTVTNCSNSGDITIKVATTSNLCVGGCFGMIYVGSSKQGCVQTLNNCDNSGNITIDGGEDTTHGKGYIGGVNGYHVGYKQVSNCDNNGDIVIKSAAKTDTSYIGGLFGLFRHHDANRNPSVVSNCNNTGHLKIETNSTAASYIGGIAAWLYSTTVGDITFTRCNNYGSVLANCTENGGAVYLGGMFGFANRNKDGGLAIQNCKNAVQNNSNNAVKITNGTYSGAAYMGGLVAYSDTKMAVSGCENSMPIVVDANQTNTVYAGGFCGQIIHAIADLTTTVNSFTNSGNLSFVQQTSSSLLSVSQFLGYFNKSGGINMTINVDGYNNTGALNINTHVTSAIYCGGIFGYPRTGKAFTNVENSTVAGSINVGGSADNNVYVGGFTGNSSAISTYTNCHNQAPITVGTVINEGKTGNVCAAGLFATQLNPITATSCSNSEIITVTGSTGDKGNAASQAYIGGITAYLAHNLTLNNVSNNGNILVGSEGKSFSSTNNLSVGGIIGDMSTNGFAYSFEGEVASTGNITVKNATAEEVISIGGVVGSTITTTAGATVDCKIEAISYPNVGMVVGVAHSDATKVTNCSVAGTIDKGKDGPHYDPKEDEYVDSGWYSDPATLYSTNFHNYIYSATVDASVATGDGCTCPTPVPETPAE